MVGIYKITSPSGSVYIGQSWNITKRWKGYSRLKTTTQNKLYNSLVKYGFGSHKFEILHELPVDIPQDVLDSYEIFYIDWFKKLNFKMLNCREGGRGGKFTEERKLLLKGRPTWNKGKKLTEEHKRKCSESLKGKIYTKDRKDKISIANKGNKGPIKSILQFSCENAFIQEWESVTMASKQLSIPRTTISDNLNGRSINPKTGFKWYYKNHFNKLYS